MKVAIYARVSTRDKDQNPETQLLPLREAVQRLGLEVFKVYVDTASAQDVAHRTAWRDLLDDAARRRFEVVLVFKLDRAFRSVKHMHDTLAAWDIVGVSFRSIREDFDTTTAHGRLMLNILGSMAEFEGELIRERVSAGMRRAAASGTKSGKPIGRPRVRVSVKKLLDAYRDCRSVRGAAQVVNCNPGTAWHRLKDTGILDELPPLPPGGNGHGEVPHLGVKKGDDAD